MFIDFKHGLLHSIKGLTYTFPDIPSLIPDDSTMVQIARPLEPGSSHAHSASALVSCKENIAYIR